MLWIPITVAAAFLQNLRSVLQRRLKGRLSTAGAAYARFVYALPAALALPPGLAAVGLSPPAPGWEALLWCALGGLSQILFTVTLLATFSLRSFAVGTTFSKLEVVAVAILGALLLGDPVGPAGWAAVALGAAGAGVLALGEARLSPGALLRGLGTRATGLGLLSAALLGASSVFYRGATLSLQAEGAGVLEAASVALAVALAMQTAMMGAWFLVFDRAALAAVLREWRAAAPAGLVGFACSVCWFVAFTLQTAAYVRALGQIELVFTFLAGALVFRERTTRAELAGVALIVSAIGLVLFAA